MVCCRSPVERAARYQTAEFARPSNAYEPDQGRWPDVNRGGDSRAFNLAGFSGRANCLMVV